MSEYRPAGRVPLAEDYDRVGAAAGPGERDTEAAGLPNTPSGACVEGCDGGHLFELVDGRPVSVGYQPIG